MQSTPLHWACYCGSLTVCTMLLAWDVSFNAQDVSGMTPLHLAVESAQEKVEDCSLIRWLLAHGAD
jgi:ankyrin repeat protein